MKKIILMAVMLTACLGMGISPKLMAAEKVERPRLVVGIVVDQMRWDYLYRYYDQFVEGGLKRLWRVV